MAQRYGDQSLLSSVERSYQDQRQGADDSIQLSNDLIKLSAVMMKDDQPGDLNVPKSIKRWKSMVNVD